jgi:inner membrane protein
LPSPVGHTLGGIALLQIAQRMGAGRKPNPVLLGGIVLATNAADLDFAAGMLLGDVERFHHGPSHSLLAAGLFGIAAGLIARWVKADRPGNFGALLGLAYASHLLLDMMSTNGQPPLGVPLFWPVSETRVNLPLNLFLDITRRSRASNFLASLVSWHNGRAIVQEALVMGACVALLRVAGLRLTGRSTRRLSS